MIRKLQQSLQTTLAERQEVLNGIDVLIADKTEMEGKAQEYEKIIKELVYSLSSPPGLCPLRYCFL